jgi:hypothetical protein
MLTDPLFLSAINCQLQILVSVMQTNQKKIQEIAGKYIQDKARQD